MKRFLKYLLCLFLVSLFIICAINLRVIVIAKKNIVKDISDLRGYDCILVLGAGVWGSEPSPMLKDRLDKAIELYNNNASSKIIMSGDHGKSDYNEVKVMKDYAINKGVDSRDIFMDHAGFSTYDSIYRAKEIFKANKIIIVTQEYHLYRSLYIARELSIDAIGVSAEKVSYAGKYNREIREIAARIKDYIKCMIKPNPTYLGEEIPVSGNGDITND